ncbi:MAG: hypothetical protein AABZ01_08810 [Gemmatimonadota bacterium]
MVEKLTYSGPGANRTAVLIVCLEPGLGCRFLDGRALAVNIVIGLGALYFMMQDPKAA